MKSIIYKIWGGISITTALNGLIKHNVRKTVQDNVREKVDVNTWDGVGGIIRNEIDLERRRAFR